MNAYEIRLRGGLAGWDAFGARVLRLDHAALLAAGGAGGGGEGLQVAAASAERGTQLAVVALVLFGTLAGLVTLLLAGQALARQVLLEEADLAILAGLGMSRPEIVTMVVVRAALTGVTGGVLAVAVAVAASPLMPVGLARQAEISPGASVDALVLGAGFLRHRGAGGGTGRAARLAGEPPRTRAAQRGRPPGGQVAPGWLARQFAAADCDRAGRAVRAGARPRPGRGASRNRAGRDGSGGSGRHCGPDLRRQRQSAGELAPAAGLELGRTGRQPERGDGPRGPDRAAAGRRPAGRLLLGDDRLAGRRRRRWHGRGNHLRLRPAQRHGVPAAPGGPAHPGRRRRSCSAPVRCARSASTWARRSGSAHPPGRSPCGSSAA